MARCLYCCREDRNFTSVEHVVPEGLGNREILLPVGVVCDQCNNGVLSTLDKVLMEFDPIALLRIHHAVPTKAGKLPKAQFGDAFVQRRSPGHVHIKADRSKSITEYPDGFGFKFRGRRPMNARHSRELTRALFKITLGLIYLNHGEAVAFSTRFDPIRAIIQGEVPFHGYLMAGINHADMRQNTKQCSTRYWPVSDEDKRTIFVAINYGGVVLATDLETRNPDYFGRLPEEALVFRF